MKKVSFAVFTAMLVMLLFAGIASAHVVVYPQQAIQGTYEKFTVRVPTEKTVPTVKIEVMIPADVDISKFEPLQGWTYATTKDATGKLTSVTWTATGAGLSPTEFGEFNMEGKISDTATSLIWKAHQTYQDGSIVDWTGSPSDATPASVTAIVPAVGTVATNSTSMLPLYLSIAALLLGIASLIITLRRGKQLRRL